jgi:hypothetical protein
MFLPARAETCEKRKENIQIRFLGCDGSSIVVLRKQNAPLFHQESNRMQLVCTEQTTCDRRVPIGKSVIFNE